MHRQSIIFLLSHKITTVQQKTTNRNNQSNQTIKKTIQNLSIINALNTNTTYNRIIHQDFFEYYNIADGNCFRTNRKYAFNKDSIQPQKTKQHNLHFEAIIE